MALGRISGPLLKDNLTRDGVNLRFENDLLYLLVSDADGANHKLGVKNSNPAYTLDVTGTSRSTEILGTTATVGYLEFGRSASNVIHSNQGDLVLSAATSFDKVTSNSDVYVNGNLHATGDITADGNIQLGNSLSNDTVTFSSEIASNFIPKSNESYDLGADPASGNRWNNLYVKTISAATVSTTGDFAVNINKFTVSASTGNTVVAGTLSTAGNFAVNTNKFTVDALTGNLVVAGTAGIKGDFAINTSKFTVQATTGNTAIAGTLGVTSDLTVNTNKFTVGATTGNTAIAGTLGVANDFAINTNKFTVASGTGNTAIAGTLSVTGHTTFEGVTSTGATGTGNLVYSASPTFTGTLAASAITASSTLDVTGLSTLATARVSNLTSGRVVLAGASGALQDSGNLVFNGTTLTLTGDQHITGNLAVDGNITLGGNITIGDNVVDTVTVNADFTSDLIPKLTNTYDIGSTTYRWKKLWSNTLDVSGASTLTGSITAGSTLTLASDFSINTNKFTVEATSGNTLVAGTLNVTGGSNFAAVQGTNGYFTGTFKVDGASTLGTLSAGGSTLSSLAVTTTASIGTTLSVTGNTTLSTVSTSGLATLSSLSVQNNALIGGSLGAGATTVSSATVSNLTNTRVILAGPAGALTDSNKLTFDGTTLTVTADASISGNLNVDGNITLGGNIRIGDNVLDTVTVQADFTSDLIPKTTNTYDLGTSLLRWKKVYANTFDVSGATTLSGNVTIGGTLGVTGDTGLSTVSTSGLATLNSASITNNASVGGDLSVTGTTTFTGNVIGNLIPNVTGTQNIGSYTNYWNNLYASGSAYLANFLVQNNTISAVNTNGGITFTPNGTGLVTISSSKALVLPVGNDGARPASPTAGMVRYNSQSNQFEGYASGNWSSLGGVRSVDGKAYIIAETSPAAGDDTLHFYSGSSGTSAQVGTWDNTALTVISPGFRVPTGDTAGRPTGVDGYIRFNTQQNKFEGFSNGNWTSLGGVSSVTGSTYIGAEAYPGAGDNTLYFYANGVLQATIDPTQADFKNLVHVSDTTNSVSTITGSITTAGGVGIAKNLYVGQNTNIAGTLTVSNDVTLSPANHNVAISPTGTGSVTINSGSLGSIDNMSIGATTARAGTFTVLTANTSASLSPTGTVTINPGTQSTMDNVSIGSTTRAPGAFTTLASNGLTTFTDTTQSTSSSSGAVVVTGGVGVGKNLYVGGNINSTGTITAGSTLNASAAVNLNPSNFNVSIAPTGTGTVTVNPASVGAVDNVNIGATTRGTGAFTSLTSNGATTFTAGTASTNTTSGTVVVTGGVGISGNLNVGGSFGGSAATFTSVTDSGLTAGRVTFAGTGGLLTDDSALTYASGTLTAGTSLVVSGTAGDITMTGGNITGVLGITASGTVQALSLKATNLTSGRVTYAGTSGVLQDSANLTFNGTTLTVNAFAVTNDATVGGTFGVTGATTLSSTLGVTGITSITNVTDSSSTSTGALKVSGGIGIAKNLNVGGNASVTGNTTVTGTLTGNGATTLNPTNYNVSIQPTGTGTVTVNPAVTGAIDNMAIGANTTSSGAFTTLQSSSTATFAGNNSIISLTPTGTGYVTINPNGVGTINNMVIGGTTAKAGTFTALTATTNASLSPSGTVTINPSTTGSIDNMNIGASTRGTGAFTTFTTNGATTFTSTTESTSTSSGAVIVSGGVGIAKNLNVGGNLDVTGTTTAESTFNANAAVNLNPVNANVSVQPSGTGTATIAPAVVGAIDNMVIGANTAKGATFTTLTTQGNVTLNGSNSIVNLAPTGTGYVTINPGALGTINKMSIGATTASTGRFTTLQATTSATFDVSGDVSIQPTGTVTVAPTTTGTLDNVNIGNTTRGTAKVTTLDANSTVTVTDSTQSTSTTTGAVQVTGGVGIVKNLYVGGNTNIAGNLTVLGTTTTVKSTVTTLSDPVITVGGDTDTGLVDPADRGIQIRYAQDISSLVTSWDSDGSSSVVANLSVTTASLGFKLGDKINIASSGVSNLDGIGTITTVGTNTVTFTAPGLVSTATTANIATVGLSKNGFFGYHPSANKFVYIPDATISSNVVTGNYGDAEFNSLTLVSALGVPQGGTGVTTLTTKGILYGNGTSSVQVTAASDMGGTNATTSYGILTTDSSNNPVWTDVIDCGTY